MYPLDLTGIRFGRWVVIGKDTTFYNGKGTKWVCRCDCGKTVSVFRQSLLSGRSKSCGCLPKVKKGINKTHGQTRTRIYKIWSSMRNRCRYPDKSYSKNYGVRGISVCKDWNENFSAFYDWAIKNGYDDSLTIERIDVNGNYCPENCRWITMAEQQRNKTNTLWVEYEGQKLSLRTICVDIDFPYKTAYRRYKKMQRRGQPISAKKLFSPVDEKYISFRYRYP